MDLEKWSAVSWQKLERHTAIANIFSVRPVNSGLENYSVVIGVQFVYRLFIGVFHTTITQRDAEIYQDVKFTINVN